ncbi:bi-domain-containing oxidoreductase [Phaeodactylibacter xiamenensis]|uniref:bi-domain-containing oxidoreductase n=1 Tax=Phaeodactylibacter xiamenensis TaxID=1524460 RepID=UPI0024A8C532|nr:bi-domain-containing oxidoreductase [Phaeodactylibacter xiamenensis]
MKQIIQDLKSGDTILAEVPAPMVKAGHLLIRTHCSLVSLGTERMLVEFGKANYFEKARQQPEKVKQVLDKMRGDGIRPTLEAVFRKLNEPLPLGYCNAGEVIAVGKEVKGFSVGDRVVSNGPHAEIVCIPKNLVAKIPERVSYEEAAFTVIGAIALQGVRLINPTFGETIVVTGLGLIGLIAVQLLKANGCRVIGLDMAEDKLKLAESWGIETINVGQNSNPVATVESLTNQIGADGVLITASAKTNTIISQAAQMSRKRGRIVLVGVVGLDIQRSEFYEKELSFQVSCSYGPGRYDENYEYKGHDYPLPFVRWTEKRNFEAVLNAIANKQLQLNSLVTEELALEDYIQVYGDMANSKSIASILKYSETSTPLQTNIVIHEKSFSGKNGVIGIIGAGNFTKSTVMPILSKIGAEVKYISSSRGLSGTMLAKKYNIAKSTTDYQDILNDSEVDLVLITTQHHSHARQVIACLEAGKHVFVEKPLALTNEQINQIITVYNESKGALSVGFNRRFSPFIQDVKKKLGNMVDTPIHVIATMNAGFIPSNHWVQDIELGGGRIIGEACHLIDLITYLADSKVQRVVINSLGQNPDIETDNASILLHYENGTNGVINYFSNGHKSYSKERFEVYAQGNVAIIDNFRRSHYFGFNGRGMSRSQDKGHYDQFKKLISLTKKDGSAIIPFDQLINTSRAAIAALESLKTGKWVDVE